MWMNLLRTNRRERGQSLIEFVVGLTIMLILLTGVLDLGRLFYMNIALYNAAEEGALYICAFPACKNGSDCADPHNMEYRLRNESVGGLTDWSAVEIEVDPWPLQSGDAATVVVRSHFSVFAPFISALAPEGLTLSGSAACRVIGG